MSTRIWPLAVTLAAAPFVVVLQNRTLAPLALLGFLGMVLAAWRAGWRPGPPPALIWPAGAVGSITRHICRKAEGRCGSGAISRRALAN